MNKNVQVKDQPHSEIARTIIEKHGTEQEELIPILHDISDEIGYISDEAIEEINNLMKIPRSKIYSVATFYRMFTTKPRGRHVIHFCSSPPCHVNGSKAVWEKLQEILGLKENETSEDGKWTLVTTSCLGLCGVGPVLLIDYDVHGNVKPEQLENILSRYE
jgi:NADH:ubiquinone oxidoreductase subunit E